MKVCSIYNGYDKSKTAVAYLIYYEKSKRFYLEIDDEADVSNLPMLFVLFAKKGIYSIDSYWSGKWVNSRIIPTDRQNLGQILKNNGLKYYDEYKLLVKGKGACSHDDFCVEELPVGQIDNTILSRRLLNGIKDVIVESEEMLVFYNDDSTRQYKISQLTDRQEQQSYLKKNFCDIEILPGGYEINWNDVVTIHVNHLKDRGEEVLIPYKYFQKFAMENLVNTATACEVLGCSRQNIDDMVRREVLEPVHSSSKNKMFLKRDVEEKLW